MPSLSKLMITTSAVAGVVCLGACSSSSSSSATASSSSTSAAAHVAATSGPPRAGGAASSAPGQGGAASAGAPPAAAGAAVDVCAKLPAAMAKQLTGLDITSAAPLAQLSGADNYGCGYSNDASSVQVQVQVQVFAGNNSSSTWQLVQASPNKTPVAGLGHGAFYTADGALYARKGNAVLQVNGIHSAEKCAALAKPILALL